ncbi:hypothetical protein CXB51_018345 [Gossypium anomalum]|uniref:Uncharacterized protein n=1 Tax=Gossypium anomalum TaxID=47600 RepID=A0A8J5ZHA6_9ROSI|nr:hypothetical protein CXB51_018345 [Gossypium anomalum]
MQKGLYQLQAEMAQVDGRIESRLEVFREKIKRELRDYLKNLFEQYVGKSSVATFGPSIEKVKGILGELPLSKSLILSPMQESGQAGLLSRINTVESSGRALKFNCPQFDEEDFRGWWSKLEQFFEAGEF